MTRDPRDRVIEAARTWLTVKGWFDAQDDPDTEAWCRLDDAGNALDSAVLALDALDEVPR